MSDLTSSANCVEWNLDDLYLSPDDPRFEQDYQALTERIARFAETYRGKINVPSLAAETLYAAIVEYEAILQLQSRASAYAGLRFAADTSDKQRGAFMQKIMERDSQLSIPMIFFDLELAKVEDGVLEPLFEYDGLEKYRHFIDNVRKYRAHVLTEVEEALLEETANTGARAFRRLFEELTSQLVFEIDGAKLSQAEILARLYSPDRDVRREAARVFSIVLAENTSTAAFIHNTLMQDKNVQDRLRKYACAEESRHLSNELDQETVDLVVDTCVRNYGLVSRFYKIKREVLGIDELKHYDRYAPLSQSDPVVEWPQAREMVLSSFGDFSATMRDVAEKFFDNGWIDAAPRKGKRSGAFCAYITPDLHPYIFQSYLGRSRDVMTLAHELGHGVHAYLSREQTLVNYHGTLPLAELASTFGEMLVFDNLQHKADDLERLALLAGKIEDTFATIFRQSTMYRFEKLIHSHRREQGELSPDDFNNYWQRCMTEMFGDSVTLEDEHKVWWSYVPHFINTPFYVYAYSFGETLVLSLYEKYRQEGQAFTDKYLSVLRCGGSKSPFDLMAMVDVDLRDPAFWQGGMNVLEREVSEFEALWQKIGTLSPKGA
jgi:oligoendopeptidase F